MKCSILGIGRRSLLAVMAILLIAVIVLVGVSTSAVSAGGPPPPVPPPYMYVDWPHHGSECDIYFVPEIPGTTNPIAGWCANKNIYIYVGKHYAYTLYDYYADYYPGNLGALPTHIKNKDWNRITYIMNHRVTGSTAEDVQQAVWYYSDGIAPITDKAKQMKNDAEANGFGYVPAAGESKPIIVDMGPCVQIQFYLVPTPPPPPVPEMPPIVLFGAGVLGIGGFVWYRKRHAVAV